MANRSRDYQRGVWGSQASLDPTPQEASILSLPTFTRLNRRLPRNQIKNDETPYVRNARLRRGYVSPRPGLTSVKTGFDSTIMGTFQYTLAAGANYTVVITTKSLYYSSDQINFTRVSYTYTTGTVTVHGGDPTVVHGAGGMAWLTNVRAGDQFTIGAETRTVASVDADDQITVTVAFSAAAGSAYSIDRYFGGDTDDLFWAVVDPSTDYFIFCQGIDPVLKLTNSLTNITRLSSSLGAAKYGILYADRLIVGNITSYPYRMQYSVSSNLSDWTGTGSGSKDWVEDAGVITGLSVIGDTAICYKSEQIYLFDRTGIAASPFYYRQAIQGVGNYIPRSLAHLGNVDIFAGKDNFYTFDLRAIDPVGTEIKDDFFSNLAFTYVNTIHSQIVREFDEYQIFFPRIGATTPNNCYVYNYLDRCWSIDWEINSNSSGLAVSESDETWDTAVGIWDTDTNIWDFAGASANYPLMLIGYGTTLYKEDATAEDDDGVDFIFEAQTKDFISLPLLKDITYYRVVLRYQGESTGNLLTSISNDGGDTWGDEVTNAILFDKPRALRKAFVDAIGTEEVFGIRVRCTAGGRFKIIEIRIEGIPSGDQIE